LNTSLTHSIWFDPGQTLAAHNHHNQYCLTRSTPCSKNSICHLSDRVLINTSLFPHDFIYTNIQNIAVIAHQIIYLVYFLYIINPINKQDAKNIHHAALE
jgi:hypothetical protein